MLSFRPGSEVEQEQLGAALAPCCGAGSVLFLDGELGVGKTTLVRGFLRGMGYPDRVKSPTYTLIEPYAVGATNVYHLDLYRVGDPDELEFLGIRDLVAEESTLLVEWPERGEGMLPPPDLRVVIRYAGTGRLVEISACSERGRQILAAFEPYRP
ncbi:MAG: tRNA (adenosine(37)-N6)-threonylcarbamoyltransferase complex ATPase subunit type 1 TsaE [Gammaproteobacteria bacterium]|nr:tRNA (adenosine(37)-N6)-threonylcarbamoyltransferase complex ATPase subunit type 1 TsaE [Gammaproteobacteria bacterium]